MQRACASDGSFAVAAPSDPRATAACVVAAVVDGGRSLAASLPPALQALSPPQRSLTSALCYGTLRWYLRLDALLRLLLRKPLRTRDGDLRCLLLIGLYQVVYTRVPPHAAVSETVAAARALGKPWGTGLVNGVLRGFQRSAATLLEAVDGDPQALTAHPGWLLDRLRRSWPDHWEQIIRADNTQAPMTLRVNARHDTRAGYLALLERTGIAAHPSPHTEHGVTLELPTDIAGLPGFAQGRVSVQDGAAQLAAELLGSRAGERVLDACAAPGGKTCHVLETQPALGELWALDKDPGRLAQVSENLRRLDLACRLVEGDAARPDAWWDGIPFDRILLDAPCSGSGVIRRHPDIKALRRPTDLTRLAVGQRQLLEALWPLLKTGGRLVYATCSILPEENDDIIRDFLLEHPDAREVFIDAAWGLSRTVGRQILVGQDDMDGFFYARLEKK